MHNNREYNIEFILNENEEDEKFINIWNSYHSGLNAINQHKRMLDDVAKNGKTNTGVYRGIEWRTNRPYNTYLCGYLDGLETANIEPSKLIEMEKCAHGGFTSGLGFDCSHAGDYSPMNQRMYDLDFDDCTYKDHEYVVNCLKKIIDCYLQSEGS